MKYACPVALIALVLAAFGLAMGYGIINLDDSIYLIDRAPHYGFSWAFTWTGDAMWTPLTWMSYWADRLLFQDNWGLYHLHNIVLHAIGSVLLYCILRAIFKSTPAYICFLATAIWALHPLRVESVVWLASRKDVLCNVFLFAAVLTWIKSRKTSILLLSLFLAALSAMAKPSALLFVVFVVAIDFLVTGDRKHPVWYVLAFALSAIVAIEAAYVQSLGEANFVTSHIPFLYKLLNAVSAISVYCVNVIVPNNLAPQCVLRFPHLPKFSMFGYVVILVSAFYVYGYIKDVWNKKSIILSPVVAGLVVFFVSLVPFLGISGFGCHAFADRFTILPMVGISISIIGGYELTATHSPALKRIAITILTLLPVSLFAMTIRQTTYWEDDITLFSHTLDVDGDDNLMAHQVMIVHEYEFEHDFAKIFSHSKAMINGSPWQMFMTAHLGPILLEAAYETGNNNVAKDIYDWQLKWGRERVKILKVKYPYIEQTETMAICDAIRLAYNTETLPLAKKYLDDLQRDFPENFGVKNLSYIIARQSGDKEAAGQARKAAYAPFSGEAILHNRWALKESNERNVQ